MEKQWFPDITNEEWDAQHRNINSIQFRVSLRADRGVGWIARQRHIKTETEPEKWVGVAFVVGESVLFLPNEDVMHDPEDVAFIDKLATKVLGYPPGSRLHLEAQIEELNAEEQGLLADIERFELRRQSVVGRRKELKLKLSRLQVDSWAEELTKLSTADFTNLHEIEFRPSEEDERGE